MEENPTRPPSVFLGLGSNLGEGPANLKASIDLIQRQCALLSQSQVFRSKPMYVEDQPDFYNQVIEISTPLSPIQLLVFLKEVELAVGRVPSYRYGPRLIDIDILYYGDLVVSFEKEKLEIPHPRIDERLFVLAPLAEIAPDFLCPITKIPIKEKLEIFLKGEPFSSPL